MQHLRGLVFRNQVSEESYCQIVVVLSLFCLILDLIGANKIDPNHAVKKTPKLSFEDLGNSIQ